MTATKSSDKPERVLSTLNDDGTRRWLEPKLAVGKFFYARGATAAVLLAVFTLIPFLRVAGRPVMLIDLPRRELTLFGSTFIPTDTLLLGLLLLTIFVGIFWVTAMFGRVWCGWACPQTVYMEYVFRPIEKLSKVIAKKLKAPSVAYVRFPIFALLSVHLANTFLAYFVGSDSIAKWVWESPAAHPAPFTVVAVVAVAMFVDFAWFREQLCVVACPYARLQAALLDRQSLIVGYDAKRGEPRATFRKSLKVVEDRPSVGDCIECGACTKTCPTGIDIRDGLQLECVGCAQCVDACNNIMDKIGKPQGLIRYSSQEILETGIRRMLRPRVVIYPAIMAILLAALFVALRTKGPTEVTVLRGIAAPFVVMGDEIQNQIRIRVRNRDSVEKAFQLSLEGFDGAKLVSTENPLTVSPGALVTTTLFIVGPRAAFEDGRREVKFIVTSPDGQRVEKSYRLLGPKETK
ncbi:MAG: cytochrome c oxidase accessory protein CcoG [Deltaproteobacteria bacterium]|nr:cytochrome c oxidase accessory protein CcoG [Deltaproteobacteria bacterium]